MCKSGLQIHNPRAVRMLDTSQLSVTADIILREYDMNVPAAAAYAERMAAKITMNSDMASDYANAATQLRRLEQS